MPDLNELLENNKQWSNEIKQEDPNFFERLAHQQAPKYLWIGCSDSRVPANVIVKLMPGEIFVHRNVANLVVHTDLNCLSVLQFAVEVLQVRHIIVCGHYGCGGIHAAASNKRFGLIDIWLRHIKDVYSKYQVELESIDDETERLNRLCEFNVLEQVNHVCKTTTVQKAWARNQDITVHGVVYGLKDGLLRDLCICAKGTEQLEPIYRLDIPG